MPSRRAGGLKAARTPRREAVGICCLTPAWGTSGGRQRRPEAGRGSDDAFGLHDGLRSGTVEQIGIRLSVRRPRYSGPRPGDPEPDPELGPLVRSCLFVLGGPSEAPPRWPSHRLSAILHRGRNADLIEMNLGLQPPKSKVERRSGASRRPVEVRPSCSGNKSAYEGDDVPPFRPLRAGRETRSQTYRALVDHGLGTFIYPAVQLRRQAQQLTPPLIRSSLPRPLRRLESPPPQSQPLGRFLLNLTVSSQSEQSAKV